MMGLTFYRASPILELDPSMERATLRTWLTIHLTSAISNCKLSISTTKHLRPVACDQSRYQTYLVSQGGELIRGIGQAVKLMKTFTHFAVAPRSVIMPTEMEKGSIWGTRLRREEVKPPHGWQSGKISALRPAQPVTLSGGAQQSRQRQPYFCNASRVYDLAPIMV